MIARWLEGVDACYSLFSGVSVHPVEITTACMKNNNCVPEKKVMCHRFLKKDMGQCVIEKITNEKI